MTLVPRFCIRLALALGILSLFGLAAFNQSASAQTPKAATNTDAYTIVQAPDGSSLCREATPEEKRAMDADSSSMPDLYPINHLEDFDKSGPRINVNDGSLPGLKIYLFATARLNNNPQAKEAFRQAAAAWEARIKTPMTVYINVDYGPDFFGIGNPPEPYDNDVIGSTSSRTLTVDYATVRSKLQASASNSVETALFSSLPSGSTIPTDAGTISQMAISASLARAIGLLDANADVSKARARIGFNSTFNFDFNPSDGLGGRMDFIAVATHEIGHALGFSSTSGTSSSALRVAILDLFRFRPGVNDFAGAQRIMTIGGSQVFFAGSANTFTIGPSNTSEAGLSTGGPAGNGGDGRQSGHWKDDNLSGGTFIGIMDPSIASGQHEEITDNDLKALNFMGYNLEANIPPPPAPPLPAPPANDNFANAQVITGCVGSVTGTNIGATKEDSEPGHSPDNDLGGSSVWYRWTAPSTGSVTIVTEGSNFDTVLGVWTGSSVGSLTEVIRNDDVVLGDITTSTVTFSATAGTVYQIAVDGWDADEGNIVLKWTASNCTTTPPPTCTYSISPASLLFNAGGGSGVSVNVTAGAGCAWTAVSNNSFITITGGASGTGSGTVTYSVAANTSTSQRTGTMTIAGQTFTVTQNGAASSVSTLQLAQNSYNINESAGSISILVNRSGDLSSAVSVNYTTTDASDFLQNCNVINGKATSRCDYISLVGTLHFAAGENSRTLSIPIVDDLYLEGAEAFFMTLTNPAGGAIIGANQTATVTITDNGNDGVGLSNPIDTTNFFVRQHYMDFLGREPDPASIGWNNQINNCVPTQPSCDRLSVSQGIYNSPEFKDRGYFIYKFFATALGRKPGYDEFVLDRARVSGFQTEAELEQSKLDFIANFMNRAEFHSIYDSQNTNRSFVETILFRAQMTYSNKENLIQSMDNGFVNRAGALRAIAESGEANSRFLVESTIVMHYFGYLRRDPDAAYQDWINIFNQTGDSRNVTNGFVNSQEYRNRFSQ